MNKGKFASLILLGTFCLRQCVSAQGDGNLASAVDMSIEFHDESVNTESKISKASAVATG